MSAADLLVIVPSRGRPGNIARLLDAWGSAEAALLVACDDDDPTLHDYEALGYDFFSVGPRLGLAGTLDDQARLFAGSFSYLGFMGDDHLPRTEGWDGQVAETLKELRSGFCYANDLLQGEMLPTAVFLTSNIVTTLGYMCPPGCRHMYLDNGWLAWGRGMERIRYLPDVIIEHLHPCVGKAEPDASYNETGALMGADGAAWSEYSTAGLEADLVKLRALP